MAARHIRSQRRSSWLRHILSVCAVVVVLLGGMVAAQLLESRMTVEVENAGMQVTAHTSDQSTAQVFMNGQWYAERNIETLLVMGIDNHGTLTNSGSYNNANQADFLALFLRDLDTGRTAAIHLNRDTMTDITTLGVTGQVTGTRRAQMALAYNYGSGDHISSNNVVTAVEHLLYGREIDHYMTVTMDAAPIINDWAGGVTVEVLDDFAGIDDTLVQGELVRLEGEQALTYVRTRMGLDDSSNLHRMERQRQYASEWVKCARSKLEDAQAVADLVMQMSDYYRSSCTAEELETFAQSLVSNPSVPTYEIQGEAVQGELYMEFHVDEEALQQLVLALFYAPVVQ